MAREADARERGARSLHKRHNDLAFADCSCRAVRVKSAASELVHVGMQGLAIAARGLVWTALQPHNTSLRQKSEMTELKGAIMAGRHQARTLIEGRHTSVHLPIPPTL